MAGRVHHAATTGIFYETEKHDVRASPWVICCRGDSGQRHLPRSYMTDGSRWLLLFHVALQACAIGFVSVACAESRAVLGLRVIDILSGVTIGTQSASCVLLVWLSWYARHPTDYVLSTAAIFAGFLCSMGCSFSLFTLSIRADDKFASDHAWWYVAFGTQLCALSLFLSCALNLAGRGGRAGQTPSYLERDLEREDLY